MNRFGSTIRSLMYVVILYVAFQMIDRYTNGPWNLASLLAFALLFLIVVCFSHSDGVTLARSFGPRRPFRDLSTHRV
jgi:hypothetical protein